MNSLGKTTHSSVSQTPVCGAQIPPLPTGDDEIVRLAGIIRTQEIKIQALIQEVAYLRRIRYGARSEALSPEQHQLFEDDIVQDIAAVESELELPAPPATPRARAGRQVLPEHLERVDVRP
jgi:transposase